jgi:hypothetical protein
VSSVASESPWQEWLIAACLVALSLVAVWSVFGDDLAQLVSPEREPALPSQKVEKAPRKL